MTSSCTGISMDDSRALHLHPRHVRGPAAAFMPGGGTEFAHLHGADDGSLHMQLLEGTARAAIELGRTEFAPGRADGPGAAHRGDGLRTPRRSRAGDMNLILPSHRYATGE